MQRIYSPKNIFLSGSSYGGSLVTLVCSNPEYKVSKVLLASPEIDVRGAKVRDNLYQGFPPKDTFLESISKFEGRLHIIHGDYDQKIPMKDSVQLYNASRTNDKRFIVLPGDHTFSGEGIEGYVKEHLRAFGK